jgi:glycosyltransferase involved in cell wall biosynthesis
VRLPRSEKRRYDVAFYAPALSRLLLRTEGFAAGGAETQVFLLARALARRGARVCVIVSAIPAAEIPSSFDGVDVFARPPLQTGLGLRGQVAELRTIRSALAAVDPKIVVTRPGGPSAGPVAVFARLAWRRYVYSSSSDLDFGRMETKIRDRFLVRLALWLADSVVTQNRAQQSACAQLARRAPIVISNITERATIGDASPKAFLWIGRLVGYKKPLAFVDLARELPDARFWMVGVPTVGKEAFARTVAEAALALPNLEFFSPRSRDQVAALINEAVAVVNTSEPGPEGMPNVFLEAWSRGVPALALSHDPDGLIERHGLGGFGKGSFDAFVREARVLWEERSSRAQLAARCRHYVAKHHAEEVVIGQWRRVLGLDGQIRQRVDEPVEIMS